MACLDVDPADRPLHAPRGRRRPQGPRGVRALPDDKAADQMNMAPVELGKMLYDKKGCIVVPHHRRQCARRSVVEAAGLGQGDPDSSAATVKMDENYVRESILYPQAKSAPRLPATRCRPSKASSRTKSSRVSSLTSSR